MELIAHYIEIARGESEIVQLVSAHACDD